MTGNRQTIKKEEPKVVKPSKFRGIGKLLPIVPIVIVSADKIFANNAFTKQKKAIEATKHLETLDESMNLSDLKIKLQKQILKIDADNPLSITTIVKDSTDRSAGTSEATSTDFRVELKDGNLIFYNLVYPDGRLSLKETVDLTKQFEKVIGKPVPSNRDINEQKTVKCQDGFTMQYLVLDIGAIGVRPNGDTITNSLGEEVGTANIGAEKTADGTKIIQETFSGDNYFAMSKDGIIGLGPFGGSSKKLSEILGSKVELVNAKLESGPGGSADLTAKNLINEEKKIYVRLRFTMLKEGLQFEILEDKKIASTR